MTIRTVVYNRRLARGLVQSQRGMTLIEIMVAVAIIALVGGALVFGVIPLFGEAQVDVARTQISTIANVVTAATIRDGEPPNSLEDLVERGLLKEKQLKDPWKQPLIYAVPAQKAKGPFDICSGGPDKREGGDDDICLD